MEKNLTMWRKIKQKTINILIKAKQFYSYFFSNTITGFSYLQNIEIKMIKYHSSSENLIFIFRNLKEKKKKSVHLNIAKQLFLTVF